MTDGVQPITLAEREERIKKAQRLLKEAGMAALVLDSGIGMEGHEWGYIVKGNQLPLQPGICFSIEPNISIVGEFGVRHENCVYMTNQGPRWFSQPSVSISQPFA